MSCEILNLSAGEYVRIKHKGLTLCVPFDPEMTLGECLMDQADAYKRKARYYQQKADEFEAAAHAMVT